MAKVASEVSEVRMRRDGKTVVGLANFQAASYLLDLLK
jgi:hypothetical protein